MNTAFAIWTVQHAIAIGFVLWGANILLDSHSRALKTICTISVALLCGFVFDIQVGNAATFIWLLVFLEKRWNWKAGELPYLLKVTIFSLPNYAILGITLSALFLASTSFRQKQVPEFDHLNHVSG